MSDIWSWNNAIDGEGTVLASTTGSAGELDVANLLDPRTAKVWRAGAMPATLGITLPATSGVAVFGLFNANLPYLGDVTLRLGTGPSTPDDLWSYTIPGGSLGNRRKAVYVIGDETGLTPVNAAYASVSAVGSVPMEIGRVWIGTADWLTQVGHTVNGSLWQVADLTQRVVTPKGGAFLGDRGARRDVFTVNYDALYPDEFMGVLRRMDRDRGLAAQMLFIPNPLVYDTGEFAVLGYLRELAETRFLGYLRAGRTMTIVEAG